MNIDRIEWYSLSPSESLTGWATQKLEHSVQGIDNDLGFAVAAVFRWPVRVILFAVGVLEIIGRIAYGGLACLVWQFEHGEKYGLDGALKTGNVCLMNLGGSPLPMLSPFVFFEGLATGEKTHMIESHYTHHPFLTREMGGVKKRHKTKKHT